MKDKSYWIKVGLESGFDDEHSAENHLNHIINIIKKLPQEVILYRLVFLKKISDLNKLKLGTHYVLNKKSLLRNHYDSFMYDMVSSHSSDENPYLITIKIDKSKIDKDLTIDNNMRYPNEQEISLKNKGTGATIIKVEKL
jgi:hypothetical protein